MAAATSSTDLPQSPAFNYTVEVNIPVPFIGLSINQNLLGSLALPVLTALGVSPALKFLIQNATKIFDNVMQDAQLLIASIPDATVTILVKVGGNVIYGVILVAEKAPIVVTPPNFQLALPNFAVDGKLNLVASVPGSLTIIRVPVPIPVVNPVPLLGITGGNVTASGSAGAGVVSAPETGVGGGAGGGAAVTPAGAVASAGGIEIPPPVFTITNPIYTPSI